jgi:hypothetical protein
MSEETSSIAAKKLNYGSSKNVDDEKALPPVANFEEALNVSGGFGWFVHRWDSHKLQLIINHPRALRSNLSQ